MALINDVDLHLIQHEMDVRLLTYNKLKTVCSFFWDYNIQLFPHVDLALLDKLTSGVNVTINFERELHDPYFWDIYISADTKHFALIDVMRILQKLL